jgi:uncharacterized membrane protein YphA (DoxX/SURF4 family)
MGILLWVAQILLAGVFTISGSGSLTRPIDDLAAVAIWPAEVSPILVRLIGAVELLGAVGLVLPALTRIRPSLTPLAALGLGTVMVLATLYNLLHLRWAPVAFNIVLGSIAAFIAWGRTQRKPIAPRRLASGT